MAEQNQLPEPQAAYDTIIENVHKRAFFHKMAQLGHVAETVEEANSLISLGFKVAEMTAGQADPFQPQPEKQAGSANRFAMADEALDKMAGVAPQPTNEASQAALSFAQDPEVYRATLVLKAAEAQALAQTEAEQAAA